MPERHGIERLRWLQESDPHSGSFGMSYRDFNPANAAGVKIPRHRILSLSEVQIEIATALIEELHDALNLLSHPLYISHAEWSGPPSDPHPLQPTEGSK